jgi:hypothetical protein
MMCNLGVTELELMHHVQFAVHGCLSIRHFRVAWRGCDNQCTAAAARRTSC